MAELHNEVLLELATIRRKLRQRFLRKPNVPAVALEFHGMAAGLRREGNLTYAAFATMAAARFVLPRQTAISRHIHTAIVVLPDVKRPRGTFPGKPRRRWRPVRVFFSLACLFACLLV
jgi:hypothetical protein